jgi:hypothetical protein
VAEATLAVAMVVAEEGGGVTRTGGVGVGVGLVGGAGGAEGGDVGARATTTLVVPLTPCWPTGGP